EDVRTRSAIRQAVSLSHRVLFHCRAFDITAQPFSFTSPFPFSSVPNVQNFESPAESFANPRIQKTKPYFDPPENDEIASAPPPPREGLPPSYKMRADPHYVDLLAARASSGRERVLSVHAS